MKKMLLGMSLIIFAIALAICSHGIENIALFIAVVGLGFAIAGYRE